MVLTSARRAAPGTDQKVIELLASLLQSITGGFLCLFLCLGIAFAADTARVTGSPTAPSILAQHDDAYIAQIASGVVHLHAGNKHGTGVCLDTPCAHVLTNYHVAAFLGQGLKVEKATVERITLATGPEDEQARSLESVQKSFVLRYNPAQDLAVLTLRAPLPKRFHGLSFATYQPTQDQQVLGIAYGLPRLSRTGMGMLSPHGDRLRISEGQIRLLNVQVVSPTDDRPATIDGGLLLTFPSNPGNSGGAVVDTEGKVVGIICGAELVPRQSRYDVIGTLALPVATVFHFLREREPELWAQAFFGHEKVPEALAKELAEQLQDKPQAAPVAVRGPLAAVTLDRPPVMTEDSDPAAMVTTLRQRAREDIAVMHNVFAEQQLEMWGENQRRELWRHEVAIYGNRQMFREIRADGTQGTATGDLPYPKTGARPGNEWSSLLHGIAAARTPLKYLGSSTYQGKPVHAYSYEATAQDKVCDFAERISRGFLGAESWTGYVDCAGGVIVDEQFNPVEISQELYLPFERLATLVKISVNYSFVSIPGSSGPLLLPADLKLACEFNNGEWHFASATWKNYHEFKVESAIRLDNPLGGSIAP
jgi:S1-C subfamily serine protease